MEVEKVPAAQAAQAEGEAAPTSALYFPAAQLVQAAAPAPL